MPCTFTWNQIFSLRGSNVLKFANRAKDFGLPSRRINGSILKYVLIDAAKKVNKKTSRMVDFKIFVPLIRISLRSNLFYLIFYGMWVKLE